MAKIISNCYFFFACSSSYLIEYMPNKESLKKEIRKIITKYLDTKTTEIFIFGSQANLKKFKAADIDVGVKSEEKISFSQINQIQDELNEIDTLHPIDLVDFQEVDENFEKIALSNIEIL